MTIEFKKVTWYSQVVAIVLFVAVFVVGFSLGRHYEKVTEERASAKAVIAQVTYVCTAGKTIEAIYYSDDVDLILSDGRKMALPQVVSGSGARYANSDESFVFWNKGNTAFINEGSAMTYASCF